MSIIGQTIFWVNRKGREIPAGYQRPDYISSDLTGVLEIARS
jgi:hypothetical protein